jgi:hypothetical protein
VSPESKFSENGAKVQDPNSPQVLTTAPNEAEAALIVERLDELGIKAEIWWDHGATCIGALPDVRIVVRQADLSRAREALDHIRPR